LEIVRAEIITYKIPGIFHFVQVTFVMSERYLCVE